MTLRSPLSGAVLQPDTLHSLAGQGERWPVVDGIAFLRTGREALAAAALEHLDAGRPEEALIALLADQDEWWQGPATDPAELRQLVCGRDTLSLRDAMALLRFGPVADYFAHRWSDPTFLAGLALLEAHWTAPRTAFELACGIGHYLRELGQRGVACTGGDIVFAKCWLARHWIAPDAAYVVFDAAAPWPLADRRYDLVMCHDAFYFLTDQMTVAARLREVTTPAGRLAVSHLHNREYAGGALGPARAAAEWGVLFPAATVYDERELRRALLERGRPGAVAFDPDPAVEAWSIVEGAAGKEPLMIADGIASPLPGATFVENPLITSAGIAWPSDRYEREYARNSTFARDVGDPVRSRRLVALPERW